MNACKNISTLRELFDAWHEKHLAEGKHNFIFDGVVNEERWTSCKIKICFLLKECYIDSQEYERDRNPIKHHWNKYISETDGQYSYDLAKHLREHTPWYMWTRVANWLTRVYPLLGMDVENPIQNIAIINIKKSDGISTSDHDDILDHANADRDLIRKELELINPDLVVCGATYDYCVKANIFDNLQEVATLHDFGNRKVAYSGNMLILDCYHPSAPSISYDKAENYFKAALENHLTRD